MQSGPHKRIENAVALLIPPVCREHVAGDLHERYTGPWQYLADAAATVPRVILSQARRRANPPVLLMECAALYLALGAAAWGLAGVSFFSSQSGFVRLLILTAAAGIGLFLGGAYVDSGSLLRIWPAAAFAILSQAALAALYPEMAVPGSILLVGGGAGQVLLLSVQFLLRPPAMDSAAAAGGAAISLDEIHRRTQRRFNTARRRYLEFFIVVILVALLGLSAAVSSRLSDRVIGGAIIVLALCAGFQVHRRASIHIAPPDADLDHSLAFYRAELQRQRDALLGVWSWYLWPVLSGLMGWALRFPLAHPGQPRLWTNIAPYLLLSVVWSIIFARLSKRDARKLQRELDDVGQA